MKKKLPFSIEEYKRTQNPEVVTSTNLPVRILCTDNDNPNAPVVAMVDGEPLLFNKVGESVNNNHLLVDKIYILGPEELNEWETAFQQVINDKISNGKLLNADDIKALIRTCQALSTFVPYESEIKALEEAVDKLVSNHSVLANNAQSLLERIKKYA